MAGPGAADTRGLGKRGEDQRARGRHSGPMDMQNYNSGRYDNTEYRPTYIKKDHIFQNVTMCVLSKERCLTYLILFGLFRNEVKSHASLLFYRGINGWS